MKKRINLVIFSESYWTKGLIYKQNIRPLELIKEKHPEVELRVISFTSLLMLVHKFSLIKKGVRELRNEGVKVVILPILFYPLCSLLTGKAPKLLIYLETFLYIYALNIFDMLSRKTHIYNLRSYNSGLAFSSFYYNKKSLFFDTRTDFITEQINIGRWKEGDALHRSWLKSERYILSHTSKTFFISETQKDDTLKRHGIIDNKEKYVILYNPVDVNRYRVEGQKGREQNFVYSGSLGNWNNLDSYMSFFKEIRKKFKNSEFYIMTPTNYGMIKTTYEASNYQDIKSNIHLIMNADERTMKDIYSRAAFGLQIMSKRDSRIGVKVVEYIAAGIIPIISENVLGAASIVKNFDIGVVLGNRIDDNLISEIKRLLDDKNLGYRQQQFLKKVNIISYSELLFNYFCS